MKIDLRLNSIIASAIVTILAAGAAVAEPHGRRYETAVDRAIADCQNTSTALTIGGLILGAGSGGHDALGGAQAGADLASVMCDIMLASATEEDRRAIIENERQALDHNETKRKSYKVKGQRHTVETRVYSYQNKKSSSETAQGGDEGGGKVCKYTENRISVEGKGGSAKTDRQLYCKSSKGEWVPANKG
jgi:hypothetical protein